MSYSAKITKAEKGTVIKDGTLFIDVSFDIVGSEGKVAERRLAFHMEATKDEITAELQKYCDMFESDHILAAKVKEEQEEQSRANETIANLMSEKE